LIFAPKKFENPARFFDPSKTPSVLCLSTRVRFRMCVICRWLHRWCTSVTPLVMLSVIVAQSRKFFSTLCEIPMGYNSSVIMAQSRKCFSTLYEKRTGYNRRWCCRWLWHNPVYFFQLSVKYRRVIICRWCRRWSRQFFLFFCVSPSQNLELQTYSTHNTITRADH